MSKQKLVVMLTVAIAALSAVGSLFISSEATSKEPAAFHTLFAISVIVMALHTGAAILLITQLRAFRARLRKAYTLYCLGFVALGFTFLQSPLLSLLDMWDSPYVETGIVALPFLAAALLLFSGSRLFARITGIKNIWGSFWAATIAAIVAAGLVFVVPHPYVGVDDLSAEGSSAITALLMVYLAFAAVLTSIIKLKTSASISRATNWLFFTLVASAVAGLQHTVLGIMVPHDHWYQTFGVSFLLHVIGGALALKAAYEFSRIESQDMKLSSTSTDGEQGVALNVVLSLAGLVSRVQDIDPTLDVVRKITAHKNPTDPYTESEQKQLANVFLELEQYLIEKEPIRQFDKASLRSTIRQTYSMGTDKIFWELIGEGDKEQAAPSVPAPAV